MYIDRISYTHNEELSKNTLVAELSVGPWTLYADSLQFTLENKETKERRVTENRAAPLTNYQRGRQWLINQGLVSKDASPPVLRDEVLVELGIQK